MDKIGLQKCELKTREVRLQQNLKEKKLGVNGLQSDSTMMKPA